MFDSVRPDRVRKRREQLVRHLAKAANDLKRFARALMKISQRAGPTSCIKLQHWASRLGDEAAAANIGARFAVCEMKNRFVNAPLLRRRFVQPHLLRELPKCACKQCGRSTE